MKPGPPNEVPPDARWDESDPLWRLLGQAPPSEPPAWFVAQTLARCRQQESGAGVVLNMRTRLVQIWRWAIAGGLATAMAVALVMTPVRTEAPPDKQSVQEAFEVVASLDTDSDSSSTSSWQDQSL